MKNQDYFVEQAKLLRVLQLIRLLKERPGYTVLQLAQLQDCNRATVYRYLKLLESVGYLLDKDDQQRHFIAEAEPTVRPHFSAAETDLLRRALGNLAAENPLRESLRRKIYLTSDLIPLADELVEAQHGRMVEQLAEACRLRHRVQLLRYRSSNSDTCRDRLVEPLNFTGNFALLNAVDCETGQLRTFKVARVGRVVMLPGEPCVLTTPAEYLDVFGLAGTTPIDLVLYLSERAYRLLWEEVPPARAFLLAAPAGVAEGFPYQFRGEVASFLGIGRFCLGLPADVRVVEPMAFREYLRERAAGAVW